MAVLVMGLAVGGCLPEGPDPVTPGRGMASENGNGWQVARGAALFALHCAGCHGMGGRGDVEEQVPALVGPDALPYNPPEDSQLRAQLFGTAAEVFHFVRACMPPGGPGRLSDEERFDILAFLLRQNGIDLRGEELTLENAPAFDLHP